MVFRYLPKLAFLELTKACSPITGPSITANYEYQITSSPLEIEFEDTDAGGCFFTVHLREIDQAADTFDTSVFTFKDHKINS